jgi:hypothetical protein
VATTNATDFLVKRDDLRESRFTAAGAPDGVTLERGGVLLRVDRFAFTANNITYAVMGERMSYWDFFPAPEGWGRIPVWGFGTVLRSACDGVEAGGRYYGYFPMSSHVVMTPDRINPGGFSDAAPHRAHLHPLYNQYTLTPATGDDRADALQMLLRPLFITSFVIEDMIADADFYGARSVAISSASSKTGYGVAFQLAERKRGGAGVEIVGLTSARNLEFTRGLGVYDRVVTYDAIGSLPTEGGAVFVDMANDAAVRAAVHHHFGEGLRYDCAVGLTHWERDAARVETALPGAAPEVFFAPARIKQRVRDWGPGGFEGRFAAAWQRLVDALRGRDEWLHVTYEEGRDAVERAYRDTLDGRTAPDEGRVLSLA